jgi:carbamate kinase
VTSSSASPVVAALGGNALLREGERATAAVQRANARRAARALAPLADGGLVVTHGNGPQVGLLARGPADLPLHVLGAETEGMIGYWIEEELANALPEREVATLLTRVEVDPRDPAFERPTKPVGRELDEAAARELERERGWTFARHGDGWRRVVPSPVPLRVLEMPAIRALVERAFVVVCAGGGGVPVARGDDGAFAGVEAVVDKDRVSAELARALGARALLLLTDVDAVYAGWGTDDARAIRRATPAELRALELDAGSMGPKVEAACAFVEAGGGFGAIGALDQAAALLEGAAGTRVEGRGSPEKAPTASPPAV